LATAAAVTPLLAPFLATPAHAQTPRDFRFRALHRGKPVGEHRTEFRQDGNRVTVTTHVDVTIKVMFFTAFRFRHDSVEIWQAGRLVSVESTTDDNGTLLRVSGYAAGDGFRILGEDGPFLASPELLTSNALWDSRLVRETRLIDVQHGSEIGMVATFLGEEQVDTPRGPIRARRYQIITPHNAGSLFYDGDGRWVKGLIEQQGEILEYALAT
jgi:hypothetical protein